MTGRSPGLVGRHLLDRRGFLLSGWAFAGVTAGSLAVDLALAYSRKRDAAA